jgi:hypothetical protein
MSTNPVEKRLIYNADFMANLYVFLKFIFIEIFKIIKPLRVYFDHINDISSFKNNSFLVTNNNFEKPILIKVRTLTKMSFLL